MCQLTMRSPPGHGGRGRPVRVTVERKVFPGHHPHILRLHHPTGGHWGRGKVRITKSPNKGFLIINISIQEHYF